ncbi:putative aconitate hydratase [Diaporthe ampelina]|uniref:Large ribosomal subunit protein bL21m n=1 Tax=Diaporthe ampelina TaxID=1214573 RepID=A0A0G2FSQ9_9PEZI|nr:putative aconitate hydratase [Diaporthe ampelina]
MSRSLFRSALELRHPVSRLPPTFLLPIRARWISSTQQHIESASTTATTATTTTPPPSGAPLEASRAQQTSAAMHSKATAAAAAATAAATATSQAPHPNTPQPRAPPTQPPPQPTGPIPQSVKDMLPLLRAQPGGHYITLHVHGRPYLVTPGDEVRLPFLMPGVRPGDVLRLNRASVLGSRDLTLLPSEAGPRDPRTGEVAYVDERLYECRAVVVGVDSEPMRTKEKTKRRNRKVKTVRSKHRYTVLRISELRIKAPEELEE